VVPAEGAAPQILTEPLMKIRTHRLGRMEFISPPSRKRTRIFSPESRDKTVEKLSAPDTWPLFLFLFSGYKQCLRSALENQ